MVVLLRDESGSFTIEATFIFPVVFLTTVALIFFSLWTFDKVSLQQLAALTADRTADNWDNSDSVSLSDLFELLTRESATTFHLPEDSFLSNQTGSTFKLQQAAMELPQGMTGQLTYSNHLIVRKVTVELTSLIHPLKMLEPWFGGQVVNQAKSTSYVAEPVEFIRNIDLFRDEAPDLKNLMASPGTQQTVTHTIPPDPKPPEIHSEAEASLYVQQLVHGHTVFFATDEVGESRKVDALDADGIAHEAKYTVNNREARQEILKDLELERKGLVKGVVWHFFRNARTGKVDLSDSLRQELEDNGIVIVIHN